MGDVKGLVIARLTRLFGPPNTVAPNEMTAFFKEYHDSLQGFDDRILEKAMNWIRDNHDTTFWPPPGVINQACRRYVPSQPVESKNWNDVSWQPHDPASRKRVRDLAQAFKATMNIKEMSKPSRLDYTRLDERVDVSRPAMERHEKRWRDAEKVPRLTDVSKRIIGEAE